jgi:hypothetical protein
MNTNKGRAVALALKTDTAYSFDRYASWTAVCNALVKEGYTDDQVEAIVMSKWARWAADQAAGNYAYGKFPAKVLVEFVRKQGKSEVEKLTQEHHGG